MCSTVYCFFLAYLELSPHARARARLSRPVREESPFFPRVFQRLRHGKRKKTRSTDDEGPSTNSIKKHTRLPTFSTSDTDSCHPNCPCSCRPIVPRIATYSLRSRFAKLHVRTSMARRISLSIFPKNDDFLVTTVSARSTTEAPTKGRSRPPSPRVYISTTSIVPLEYSRRYVFPRLSFVRRVHDL